MKSVSGKRRDEQSDSPERKTAYKTLRQYSKPLPDETMEFLRGIAADYARVKAYVYRRYSGIASLEKLYPGYTVQNEMNAAGYRKEINLPYSYYSMAMFEALADIKSGWANLKNKISELVRRNKNLSDAERHYIFTVLKTDRMYAAALNRRAFEPPAKFAAADINYNKLHNLICRLTRKHKAPCGGGSGRADYFKVVNTGFRYADGGLWLGARLPNKRLFIPLTDGVKHSKPLMARLKENTVEILVPAEVKVKTHRDYTNKIALHLGYAAMFTASGGGVYGGGLGQALSKRTERIHAKQKLRGAHQSAYFKAAERGALKQAAVIKANNLGVKKFISQNNREMAGIKSYINAEINRMLETEKPREIIIPSQSIAYAPRMQRAAKHKLSRWTVGYIRKRLSDKCAQNAVKLTPVNVGAACRTCALCGKPGKRVNNVFVCGACGVRRPYAQNTAKNLINPSDG